MGIYNLVNPYVSTISDISVNSQSPKQAAKELYNSMSKSFRGHLPSFYFTIRDENDTLHHFESIEQKFGNEVSVSLKSTKPNKKETKNFKQAFSNFKNEQNNVKGGKSISIKDDDDSSTSSSSSSSSSSSLYPYRRKRRQLYDPLIDWWYYPPLYLARHISIPVFKAHIPINTVQVALSPGPPFYIST